MNKHGARIIEFLKFYEIAGFSVTLTGWNGGEIYEIGEGFVSFYYRLRGALGFFHVYRWSFKRDHATHKTISFEEAKSRFIEELGILYERNFG